MAADAEVLGEADGGTDDDTAAEGDGDAVGDGATEDADGDGDAEGDGEGDADGDGDVLDGGDPAAADADPTTRWPAGICAEPVVTSVRDPTDGGASAGTGAAGPFIPLGTTVARVADAGT